ncbi:MAG: flagellar basal body rod protein FlgB, partial [Lachnospiraceae bacterium]
ERALKSNRYDTIDEKVENMNLRRLNPVTYRDHSNFSYRLDGNNVDIDTENVELASNQIKYQGLMGSISQEFANLQAVMK